MDISRRELLLQLADMLALAESDPDKLIRLAMGCDPTAQALVLALMQEEEAEEAEEELQRIQAVEAEQQKRLNAEQERGKRIFALMAMSLGALGFVRHTRNPWTRSMQQIETNSKPVDSGEIRKQIRALVRKTGNRHPGAVNKLQEMARAHPHQFAQEVSFEMWDIARCRLAEDACPTRDEMRDDFTARVDLVALDLAGENPSAARRLCAQVAAFCWAEHWILSTAASASKIQQCHHPKTIQQRNAAQRRFLSALKTLAQITQAEARPRRMTVSVFKQGESVFAGMGMVEAMASIGANK